MRREAERARYDRAAVHAILDAGWLAHVGIAVDGVPSVLPMVYARVGEEMVLHGSVASRLMRHGDGGLELCATVTHVDGLVLARSAFHTSVNYRCAVVRGRARRIVDPEELERMFAALVDQAVPGRAAQVRAPSRAEARQTMVLALPLEDVAVKARTGDPADEPEDLDWPVWAGVVPLRLRGDAPVPAADLRGDGSWAPPAEVTLP